MPVGQVQVLDVQREHLVGSGRGLIQHAAVTEPDAGGLSALASAQDLLADRPSWTVCGLIGSS